MRVTIVICTQYLYIWNVKRQLLNFCNIETCIEIRIFVSIITSSFLVYVSVDFSETKSCLHLQNKHYNLTEAIHVLYNVQSDDKFESEFMDCCWNIDHHFFGQEDLLLDI